MSREERDLAVQWVRQMRRQGLPAHVMRKQETTLAKMRALDPRSLKSEPSPRQVADAARLAA